MIHRAAFSLVATILVALAACSDGNNSPAPVATPSPRGAVPTGSAGCEGPAVAPGVTERAMMSGGVERTFQLTVPESYDGTEPFPIVLALHALTVRHGFAASIAGFSDMAPQYDFIGVAPSGLLDGTTPYWLAAPSVENYDLVFFGDLLDLLEAELCVDPARVYSTGMSNGGQMSSLLACRMSDRITAVAPVAGVEFSEECEGEPVPVMAFHGDADPIVTYEGGGLNARAIADRQYWKGDVPEGLPVHGGVDAAMNNWAAYNGCEPEPVEERVAPHVLRRTWRNCEAETVLYVVEGGGHAWPGKPVPAFEAQFGPGTTEIDASALMFEFFFGE